MGTLSQRGTLEPSKAGTSCSGAVATGGVAAIMLLVGGDDGSHGLQNMTIVAAVPFALVMIGIAWALVKDLRQDPMTVRRRYGETAVEQAVVTGVTEHGDDFALRSRRTAPLPEHRSPGTNDGRPLGRPRCDVTSRPAAACPRGSRRRTGCRRPPARANSASVRAPA